MKMIIDGRYKASWVGEPCGSKFLRLFIFLDWAFFLFRGNYFLRLGVIKQECGLILLLLNFVINSFPRLSDFTDWGWLHI